MINSLIGTAVQVQRLWIRPVTTCWAAQMTEVTSINLDNPIQIPAPHPPTENIQCCARKPVSSTRLSHAVSSLLAFSSFAGSLLLFFFFTPPRQTLFSFFHSVSSFVHSCTCKEDRINVRQSTLVLFSIDRTCSYLVKKTNKQINEWLDL